MDPFARESLPANEVAIALKQDDRAINCDNPVDDEVSRVGFAQNDASAAELFGTKGMDPDPRSAAEEGEHALSLDPYGHLTPLTQQFAYQAEQERVRTAGRSVDAGAVRCGMRFAFWESARFGDCSGPWFGRRTGLCPGLRTILCGA